MCYGVGYCVKADYLFRDTGLVGMVKQHSQWAFPRVLTRITQAKQGTNKAKKNPKFSAMCAAYVLTQHLQSNSFMS